MIEFKVEFGLIFCFCFRFLEFVFRLGVGEICVDVVGAVVVDANADVVDVDADVDADVVVDVGDDKLLSFDFNLEWYDLIQVLNWFECIDMNEVMFDLI